MIRVRFTTFEFDAKSGQWAELPVAELTITGPHADWLSPEITIVDPATGEQVTPRER